MGRTEVEAVIIGPQREREFTFTVAPRFFYVGLPAEEIEDLGLVEIPSGAREFRTAAGPVSKNTYGVFGRLQGQGFCATVVTTNIPLIGYSLLENLRFIINPDTRQLEPLGPDELGPPFLVSQWPVGKTG